MIVTDYGSILECIQVNEWVNQRVYLSICLSTCVSIHLSIDAYIYHPFIPTPSTKQSTYLYLCLSLSLSLLAIFPSMFPPMYFLATYICSCFSEWICTLCVLFRRSVSLSFCVSVSVFLFIPRGMSHSVCRNTCWCVDSFACRYV